jgi:hypothetical protein
MDDYDTFVLGSVFSAVFFILIISPKLLPLLRCLHVLLARRNVLLLRTVPAKYVTPHLTFIMGET